MSVWSPDNFLNALKTLLEARGGLSGVEIFTALPGAGVTPECVIFHTVRGAQEPGRFGDDNDEEYVCEGSVFIERAGAGEAMVVTVRQRAEAIFNELENAISPNGGDETVSGTVGYARLGQFDLNQGFGKLETASSRWAEIAFEINVTTVN